MLIDVGPATLTVSGEKDGEPFLFDEAAIAARVETILADIRDCLPVLKQKAYRIKRTAYLPEVGRRMVEAVRSVDESTLTPMAAVAGAVADLLKEWLGRGEADFISVNNGGDVSVLNRRGRTLTIGIGDIATASSVSCILKIEGLRDFGVASSGFGGRSFTLGLADVTTVLASSAALADAGATFICNKTTVETGRVIRRRASEIDPSTDIPDDMVTVERGVIGGSIVRMALANGREEAEKLKQAHVIMDAVVVLKEQVTSTIDDRSRLTLEVSHGNKEDGDRGGGYLR